MNGDEQTQLETSEIAFTQKDLERYKFNFTDDKLIRYLRDRRLNVGLNYLRSKYSPSELEKWKVLIICGSVGGEGVFFKNAGFKDVTLSDINRKYLNMAKVLAPQLNTLFLNGEALDLEAGSYDLVVVQDGLHHLPRPATGFTEMLRVAKKAILVIEPYDSVIGNMMGTKWEVAGGETNFVYRWNRKMINQTVKSYLLRKYDSIKVFRLWDHNLTVLRLVKALRIPKKFRVSASKTIYQLLSLINFSGNMLVAVVTKN